MRESYVRPVLRAHEPLPRWIVVWRFRLVMVLFLVLLGLATVEVVQHFQGVNRQQPGLTTPTDEPTP